MLCALLSLLSFRHVLVVEKQGQVIFQKVLSDDWFAVVFVHSVERTLVEERFKVEPDGSLLLFETRYSSYGAGLPSDAEEGFAVENGKFVLKLHRRFERIVLRVSHVEGHGLLFNDGVVWFKDLADDNDALTIYVRVRPSLVLKMH
ncbi:MAG: hypothetical protein XD58_0891 [Thermotoga sp. 50_1627]|nr:MAG: hypothetical protein XD45_1190 [Thermotoga sp. 50_64]KUK25071.1 MAG: hypothetical protein XD58_0891 [Thermotoga sp. 50_1627]MDK2923974.1 hypothetical protein [Pseudothermotoga sp.]